MHNGGEAALTDALYTGTPTLYAGFSALVAVLLLIDFALLKGSASHADHATSATL